MSLNLRQCDILYRPDIQRSGAIVAKDEMLHSEPKGVVTFHANIDRPNLRMIPVHLRLPRLTEETHTDGKDRFLVGSAQFVSLRDRLYGSFQASAALSVVLRSIEAQTLR